MAKVLDEPCSIARSLSVLGEKWTFLVLREALLGATRFAEFRDALGVAPDVLSARLATLVDHGLMVKVGYREPGSRGRAAYELTPAGRELWVVLAALQEWGDVHLPWPQGPAVVRRDAASGQAVRVAFVDEQGRQVDPADVVATRTAASSVADGPQPIGFTALVMIDRGVPNAQMPPILGPAFRSSDERLVRGLWC